MKNLIKEAAEAKKQIANKERAIKAELELLEKRHSEISDFYWKAIRKLEDEKHEKVSAIERLKKEVRENQSAFFEQTQEPISKLKTVLSLIEHSKREDKKDLSLKPHSRHGIVEEVAVLVDNQYLNLRVLIYTNDKSKNKYTLCIAGRSFFSGVIKYPFAYGSSLSFDIHSPSILVILKEAPTVEELVVWYGKNKCRQFWNEQEHNEVVNLYEWVLENCNTYEWQLEYLLDRKDYWENRYSHGTDKPEYKQVLKAIKRLKMKEPA